MRELYNRTPVITSVYCADCGKVIAELDLLLTPPQFKKRYGKYCPFCGKENGKQFKICENQEHNDKPSKVFALIVNTCKNKNSTHSKKQAIINLLDQLN